MKQQTIKCLLISAALSCNIATLQATTETQTLPIALSAKPLNIDAVLELKNSLQNAPVPCGLEHAHEIHDATQLTPVDFVMQTLSSQQASIAIDSARNLIFTKDELSAHELALLIESIGEVANAQSADLLRNILLHAQVIAHQLVPDDVDEKIIPLIINSNIDDIHAAIFNSIKRANDRSLDSLLEEIANRDSHVSKAAREYLEH